MRTKFATTPFFRGSRFKLKPIPFWIGLLVGFYLSFEGVSFLGLWFMGFTKQILYEPISKDYLSQENRATIQKLLAGQTTYFTHSPTLGWTLKPQGSFGVYRANDQGLRAERNYEIPAPPGVFRILAFGDSFTHGEEVKFEETWEEQLRLLHPRLEVLNFGVNAYGLDQAFLRYQQEGVPFRARIVLIGFLSENIERVVNVFRPFYYGDTRFPLSKPRFVLQKDQLILLENPLPRLSDYQRLLDHERSVLPQLGVHDDQYRTKYGRGPYDFLPSIRLAKILRYGFLRRLGKGHTINWDDTYHTESEAFQVTARIFQKFYETVLENGSLPLIVLFPDRRDLERYRGKGIKRYEPLENFFRQKGFHYIDLFDAFDRYGKDHPISEIYGSAHYSPLGNEMVARYIFDYLKENHLLNRGTLEGKIHEA